jgi:predicted dehydrogenase
MKRRTLLQTASILATAGLRAQDNKTYTVGVLGHTGRGNFGHGLDTVWKHLPQTRIVAVSDGNSSGLGKAKNKLEVEAAYTDYKELLATHRPDIVAICPRHPDQHADMIIAACHNEAKGIYIEKPYCRNLGEADAIQNALSVNNTKLAVAHRNRYHPLLPKLHMMIAVGMIGKVSEIRCRGKEDRRGGGEDLWVLGTHVLNLARQFSGRFTSCSAVLLQDEVPIQKKHCKPGNEALGTLAGNELHATYLTESGIPVYFDTIQNHGQPQAGFGLVIVGNEGMINLRCDKTPFAYFQKGTPWNPSPNTRSWQPIGVEGPGSDPLSAEQLHELHHHLTACKDLISAMEENREPLCNHIEGMETVEMVMGAFESHRQGGKWINFPLNIKTNPLDSF